MGLAGSAQPSSFNFRKLGISEGLHDGTIRCVGQDTFGFIWIGSVGALNRFDGKKVEVFTYDLADSTTPYSSQPRCMHSDKQGRFWIGYETGLLEYVFQTGAFRKVATMQTWMIAALASINDSTLFVGAWNGLIRLNTRTDDTLYYTNSKLPRHAALKGAVVRDLCFRAPYLYLATNRGLILYHVAKDSAFAVDVPLMKHQSILSIDIDQQGDIWMAAYVGIRLSRLHSDWKTLDVFDKWLSDDELVTQIMLKDVLVDHNNNVWFISAAEGIMQYVRKKDIIIKHRSDAEIPSGLNTNNFRNLFQDRNGLIWAGSDIGAVYFNPAGSFFSVLMPFEKDLSVRERRVGRAIAIDSMGMVWMGGHEGLSAYDPATGKYRHWRNELHKPPKLYDNLVRSLWASGRWVWIGTGSGVNRYDIVHNRMEFVSERYLPRSFYNTITGDRNGNIWFGCFDTSALYWYSMKDGSYHSIHQIPSLRQYERTASVSYVVEDRKSRLWISLARQGVIRYDKLTGKTVRYDTKQDAAHRIVGNQVIDIKEDSKGVMWLSTLNGISGIDAEHGIVQNFNRSNGLVNNWVSPIVVDSYDRVWIGASGGLSMLEKDRKTMTTFTLADGLPSVGFPEHAGIIDKQGVIWMATYNGYLKFNTHEYKPDTIAIPFYATSYSSTDGVVHRLFAGETGPVIKLTAGDNAVTFEMTALNFSNPLQTRYAYRLEGFESDWHYSQDGKAVYTNIPGGSYKFLYKAASGNTPWSKINPRQVRLEIGSFFYQKGWFWILVGILVLASLWLYYRSRLSAQRKIYELQRQADALQKENALVMYEGLKQQLNPHFLFNSLTSLSGLIHSDTRLASRFLERLGKLYRYVLNAQESETVTLEEELRFAENYLHLQKTRFGDGLVAIDEVDKAYYQKRIAPVTLQKLIENAIKHNIIDADSPLVIRIYVEGDYLVTENNLQRKSFVETSNMKGLSGLHRLYSFISPYPIVIEDDTQFFIVKIPLL
jgi:ligand-binding sensor domain-containing protein